MDSMGVRPTPAEIRTMGLRWPREGSRKKSPAGWETCRVSPTCFESCRTLET